MAALIVPQSGQATEEESKLSLTPCMISGLEIPGEIVKKVVDVTLQSSTAGYGGVLCQILKTLETLKMVCKSFHLSAFNAENNIISLNLNGDRNGEGITTNNALIRFKNLQSLSLYDNRVINDQSVRALTALTKLDISENGYKEWNNITDEGISMLTNLTDLDICCKDKITDTSLCCFSELRSLTLRDNKYVTNKSIQILTNLTSLTLSHISSDQKISPEVIRELPYLQKLSLDSCYNDADMIKMNLTALRHLRLTASNNSGACFADLPNLTSLNLWMCRRINDDSIRNLISLTDLIIDSPTEVTDEGIQHLTNLTALALRYQFDCNFLTHKPKALFKITGSGLRELTNLITLDITGNEIFNKDYLTDLRSLTTVIDKTYE